MNIQQTVLPSSAYGLTGNAASNYPYVYTDGDGTEHYIQKITEDGATVYKDEDGLNLTLEIGGECSYRIKDKLGNIKWCQSGTTADQNRFCCLTCRQSKERCCIQRNIQQYIF